MQNDSIMAHNLEVTGAYFILAPLGFMCCG